MVVEPGHPRGGNVERPRPSTDRHGESPMEGRRAAQPAHKPEPIEPRHLEITEDNIGLDVPDQAAGLHPITRTTCPQAECPEQAHHSFACVIVVLNDEDAHLRWPVRGQRRSHTEAPLLRARRVPERPRGDPEREGATRRRVATWRRAQRLRMGLRSPHSSSGRRTTGMFEVMRYANWRKPRAAQSAACRNFYALAFSAERVSRRWAPGRPTRPRPPRRTGGSPTMAYHRDSRLLEGDL